MSSPQYLWKWIKNRWEIYFLNTIFLNVDLQDPGHYLACGTYFWVTEGARTPENFSSNIYFQLNNSGNIAVNSLFQVARQKSQRDLDQVAVLVRKYPRGIDFAGNIYFTAPCGGNQLYLLRSYSLKRRDRSSVFYLHINLVTFLLLLFHNHFLVWFLY